ncbi:MAG: SRPBCC domain-containing protein [Flavobacteriales bacterium]|jgi:uncharacterized protein YndB with AHSA1/START domain|nr:SRPBCC domain-containing protein [Flavobacteriales bacterium]MBT5274190.1 SRPBCC domain-containing protein [Flavobacteriales bacterium]MBT6650598.1 SRPBCC domain-containing protein [Flavobacteriales bacterium]MBT6964901.1 SRPBCC domain-containing protein [Flavobacteriales bacterium]
MSDLIKYNLEFQITSSVSILYNRLSNPSGLAVWFANDVIIKDKIYSFFWDGHKQDAKLLKKKDNQYIRFKWADDDEAESYFEFKIQIDEMTQDVALIVTDFAEDEDEKEEQTNLWTKQIDQLKRAIGS